jgi:glutathionylspermidine synthase
MVWVRNIVKGFIMSVNVQPQLKQFRLENKYTGEILGFERAESSLELIKRLDLCTRENAHIKIIQTN